MEIAVVYESLFGNTHEVADAIAAGLREARPDATVVCLPVTDADPGRVAAAELLVIGGPTHMRGMSTHRTRKMGLEGDQKEHTEKGTPIEHEPELDVESPGLRDWFHTLPKATDKRAAAAFDTRAEVTLAGGAAHGIGRRLHRHGYHLVADVEGFVVEDADGPLRAGEADRARAWGTELGHKLPAAATAG